MTVEVDTATERNKQVVLKIYDAVRALDLDSFFDLCHPDVVLHVTPSLPMGGVHRGRGEFSAALGALAGVLDISTLHIVRLVADGSSVAAFFEIAGREPDGGTFTVTEWWQVEDGLVVAVWPFHWDTDRLNTTLRGSGSARS